MSHPMHAFTAPVFVRTLRNLQHVLDAGQAYAAEKNIAPEVMLQTRLIPDMLPLVRQVQIATDHAKNGCARLTGTDAPSFPDEETTFDELRARIARCIAYVESFDAAQFDGADARPIHVKTRTTEMNFNGQDYVTNYALPNLYFHASIAYAILRTAGVPIGKADWLGAVGR
ncbi:DUF2007 domain containing protein [Lysobacter dokdonensis DS-58]|uniref:DUF2007 domain containing protein n=1 Tax=Lysobacter dokdonensis DS-58 TaxID=1300345 RepID=A0A0A2WDW0_9GAMM|nr:DUF1993 domain-containing protein [Lysobacter dokdonensis]KGQ17918.1 DUF2007 domain containing protein [Lysobacter dokdonensis DS-58]